MFKVDNYKQVIEGKPNLSKWTLRYSAFGQNFEFSWMARLLKVLTSTSTICMCYEALGQQLIFYACRNYLKYLKREKLKKYLKYPS